MSSKDFILECIDKITKYEKILLLTYSLSTGAHLMLLTKVIPGYCSILLENPMKVSISVSYFRIQNKFLSSRHLR